jgi:hypothetical protein
MRTRPSRPPANLQTLNRRIAGLATELGRPVRRVQRAVANTVVGQMLPLGVVKGGTAIKLRVGEAASRFTPDVDTSPRAGFTLDEYVSEFQERLHGGWGGFTGTVETLDPAQPAGVPDDYVMRPYRLALAFQSRHWLSVPLEVGHDEVGSTADAEPRMAGDILAIFEKLVLPRPEAVPLMATHHQVAQKLHACTSQNPRTGRNDRAHDLVDLQILVDEEPVDLGAVGVTARRLFASRRAHPWPPTVVAFEGWPAIYAAAAEDLDVLPTVDAAVAWVNQLVARTEEASSRRG